MRHRRLLGYPLLALLALAIGQGVASAQAPDATSPPRQVEISIEDQLGQADTYISRMDSVRDRIRRQLEEARQQRDVVKTLCLNDKLNQLDVALRSAQDRKRSLESAAKQGDKDLSNHEFTILSVLFQRAEQLDAEALQCIGKEVGFVGESSVSMDVDPNLPTEDPSEYPPDVSVFQPPTCSSCFK